MITTILNIATPEGRELGQKLARFCEQELAGKEDKRCSTCAVRAGDHIANGSPETLMSFLKCAMEGEPFWCHERDRACSGWAAMVAPKDMRSQMPWHHTPGTDEP